MRKAECLRFFLTLAALSGCVPAEQSAPIDLLAIEQQHEAIHKRTERRFERAAFFSPDPDTTLGDLRWMSPLIVEESDPQQSGGMPQPGFGRLIEEQSGSIRVELDEPAVYHIASSVKIHGKSFSQSTYLWFYPPAEDGDELRWRGFRMLLDDRGFAMIWEILSSDAKLRVFYVSKPVEEAARRQYGSPLPGRRYCTEPDLRDHPDIIVARIVGDGPQPMGPFLYLDYPDLHVTTLICRCEPSQVDLFPQSRFYRLIVLVEGNKELHHVLEYCIKRLDSSAEPDWPSELRISSGRED